VIRELMEWRGEIEGNEVVYAVEWEEIRRRTREEKQSKGDPSQAKQSKASKGRGETRTRASQPFQPRLRPRIPARPVRPSTFTHVGSGS